MINITDYDTRRSIILEFIVEAYVSTASPVGSELVSRKMRQSLSSATIRNIMKRMEEEGLLEQPHTSAGRVPTELGYRVYVNNLAEARRLGPDDVESLARLVQPEERELEQLFERAGEALAELSHQAAFVVAPSVRHSRVRQIEFLPLGVRKLLCVFVAQEAIVVSHVVEVSEPISRDEALSLAHFLNTELGGLPIEELLLSLERRLLAVNDAFYHLVKRSLDILQTALATEPEERFFLEGTAYLFGQPEFQRNPRKAHGLLRQLELQQALLERVRADMKTDGTHVRIGREVGAEGLEECSYVLAPFRLNRVVVGGVGVLGPKRMDYRRMRALTEGMAALVTDALTRWGSMS